MLREWGLWLMLFGGVFGLVGIGVLAVLLSVWGLPAAVTFGLGVGGLMAYVISVSRAFLA